MRSAPIIVALKLVAAAAWLLAIATFLLWLSGDWSWLEGWIFGVWLVVFCGGMFSWMYFNDPALLAERMRMPGTGGESRSDLAILIGAKVCFVAWLVVPSLQVRFGWTPRLPLWSEIFGGILLLGGSYFIFCGLTDNSFASQMVRIQTERDHHVIDTGVYRLVRHPMYLGGSLMFFGGAMLLGSIWGLLVSFAVVGLLVVRIGGEEKLLARDLEGYKEYRQKVRYRLVPHVW